MGKWHIVLGTHRNVEYEWDDKLKLVTKVIKGKPPNLPLKKGIKIPSK